MKNLLFLSFAALCFASCTKTKTDYVTLVKNDTTFVSNPLIGIWHSITPTPAIPADLTFFYNYMQWSTSYITSFTYVASADSIFESFSDLSLMPQYGYKINSDTLFLYPARPSITKVTLLIKQS